MTSLKLLALLVAILLVVQLITAAPLNKRHKKHKHSKKPVSGSAGTILMGEHPTAKLPAGTPQKDGLATNWTITAHPGTSSSIKNDGIAVSSTTVNVLINYAQLASIAYCSVGSVGSPINCASYCSNFPTTIVVATFNTPNTRTLGYIARDDVSKEIILSYRGSANIQSFINDLQFIQEVYTPVSGAYVHTGGSSIALFDDFLREKKKKKCAMFTHRAHELSQVSTSVSRKPAALSTPSLPHK